MTKNHGFCFLWSSKMIDRGILLFCLVTIVAFMIWFYLLIRIFKGFVFSKIYLSPSPLLYYLGFCILTIYLLFVILLK